MANEEIAALVALSDCKVDINKLAALLNLPEPTIRGRLSTIWKPAATKMITDAKNANRLNADGTVNKANLPKPGTSPRKKNNADHVVSGRVTKKQSTAANKTKAKGKKATDSLAPGDDEDAAEGGLE